MRPLLVLLRNLAAALLALLQAGVRALVRAPAVEWVFFEIDGPLGRGAPHEAPPHHPFAFRLPRGARLRSLEQLRRELAFLAQLPDLRGLVLRVGQPLCGGALLREVRAELERFRASGKRVVVHSDWLSMRTYWLASVADEIWLTPRGRLELTGFAAVTFAAARPLRKLGIAARVIRAGTFKAAGELFGADEVSPENARQLDDLVGDLADLFVRDVARTRRLSEERVRAALDAGPYTAKSALAAGLVDALLYADEVRARLGRDAPEGPRRARVGPFAAVLARHAPPADWMPLVDRRPVVAVVDVEGVIAPGRSRTMPGAGATAGSETLVPLLSRLRRDKRVRAVVLRIDSRGGSALASDLIWRAVRRLDEEKPVVAWMENVAASGGYYIAAGARRIVAAPTCITGSIGVIALRPDFSGALAKVEVDRLLVKRGSRAAIYRPEVPLAPEDEAALQRDILETYGEFVSVVAEGRAMPEQRVRELAEGRVYLAPRAHGLGLVDGLGPLEDALAEARRLAQVAAPARVVRHRSPRAGLRELLRALRRPHPSEGAQALLQLVSRPLALWAGPEVEP